MALTNRRVRSRIAVALLCSLLPLVLVSCTPVPSAPAKRARSVTPRPTQPWSGRCVGVADGDTISILFEGVAVRVRLNGVDSPEKRQAFGSVAKQFTSNAVFGKTVTVSPTDTDRYGRTVADVRLPDGRSLNEQLVAAGLAWWYRQYAPGDRRLQALENSARKARRGLWADPNPLPPWQFRKQR